MCIAGTTGFDQPHLLVLGNQEIALGQAHHIPCTGGCMCHRVVDHHQTAPQQVQEHLRGSQAAAVDAQQGTFL